MRTTHIARNIALVVGGSLALAACGGSTPSGSSSPTSPAGTSLSTLQPASLGNGECQANSAGSGVYAQVAVSEDVSCDQAGNVAEAAGNAKGSSYIEDGFTCTATAEGTTSPWAAAWSGTYYAYSCKKGSEQVAFNWGTDYVYDGQGQSTTTTTGSTSGSASGALQPTTVGNGDCGAASAGGGVYAQVAVSNTTCETASAVAEGAGTAKGAAYSSEGFTCTATAEGSGSPWASAWGSTYYAYSCVDGSQQVAFNWGTDYTY